ncbi:MAG TPA: response regulator [bacterium]|mgnify:CR=1 FL=1|nr:response regulator [bacterium]HPN30512.1 response regulator [bacterium]
MNQKILLVDDHEQILQLNEFILKKLGYKNIFKALSAAEALKMLMEEEIDLMILDISLPVLDGLQMLEIIKQNPALHDLKVIILTANYYPEVIDKAIKLGCNEVLSKPFSPIIIIKAVNKIFNLGSPEIAEIDW